MNIAHEDEKLHDDGIFDGLMGYKEWFHYLGTFYVSGNPLNFMLGFPCSYPGMGALGWISFEGNQYALAGNTTNHNGFFEVETHAEFQQLSPGYRIEYPEKPASGSTYTGNVTGKYPDYAITIKTPQLDLEIKMSISSPASVTYRIPFEWLPLGERIAAWFHSGDITTSIKGTVLGKDITSTSSKNTGWYERNWAKIPLPPSEWFWLMAHLDNGAVFDLLIESALGMRVHALDECWLYNHGGFHEFYNYQAQIPDSIKKATKTGYSKIIGECIKCYGKTGGNSFQLKATVTDFRRYEYCSYYAHIKWTNLILETEGKAIIDGSTIDMTGSGKAEIAPILYWWL